MHTEGPDITDPRKLRQQAEKLLQLKEKARLDQETEADTKKLMHELQVHHIELEMQNEELLKAYETAETALKKYTLVFDQAPMGLVTLESDGIIAELNFSAAEMLGDRRFSLTGTNFKWHVTEDSRTDFCGFLEKIYKTHNKEACRIFLASQRSHPIYIEGIVIENNNQCMLAMVDISRFVI